MGAVWRMPIGETMPDANGNGIPDNIDRWIGVALALVVGVLTLAIEGAWGGPETVQWLSRAVAIVAVVSNVFGWGIASRPGKGAQ